MYQLLAVSLLVASFHAQAKLAVVHELELKPIQFKQTRQSDLVLKNAKDTEMEAAQAASPAETFFWQHLSPNDGFEGTQSDRAYDELGLTHSEEVVVAVIDSGVDIEHEDLIGKIWVNEGEIPDNGIDDDGNGYIDDVHGWNFIGGADGRNIGADSLEVAREVKRLTTLKKQRQGQGYDLSIEEEELLARVQAEVDANYKPAKKEYDKAISAKSDYKAFSDVVLAKTDLVEISIPALENLISIDEEVNAARDRLIEILTNYRSESTIQAYIDYYGDSVNYYYNIDFDPRAEIIGDDYLDVNDRYYGNNDVTGPDADHGTHVSGIIAANRDNSVGMKGIATNVKIMAIRCVPNGDERDKDVANSIRYAVDNGAHIINMSFGKAYSPYKKMVDDAVAYAASKGVLLIHAAGNDASNNDLGHNFPTDISLSGVNYPNWIEVGASTWDNGALISAPFSNFGKVQVDIFAPGFQIYSSVHHGGTKNEYAKYNGTSMACPTVAGVAALVAGQNARLRDNAVALRELLLQTSRRHPLSEVVIPNHETDALSKTYVQILENDINPFLVFADMGITPLMGFFSQLSVSGGVVDAYAALSIIDTTLL